MRLTVFLIPALAFAQTAEWPEPRQNAHLTSIQPVPSNMKNAPELAARYDLGRSQPAIRPAKRADGSDVGLCVVSGKLCCYDTSGALLWELHPPGLNFDQIAAVEDLNGDGAVEALLEAGRPAQPYGAATLVSIEDGRLLWRYDVAPMSYAWYLGADRYLPNDPRKQIIVLMHAYPPDKDNGYIAMFAFEGDSPAPAQRWRYDFHQYTCFPTLHRSDLDGDGIKELVVQTHSRMWFLDPVTGAMKHFYGWDVSPANVRSYGLVKFVDLDRDGDEDFLCIATFAQHHEVLLNQGGRMEKAWSYGWPESVTTGKVASTWPESPDVDVDGDGRLEIIVSMFNSENEGAWLVRIYDALTGELKYRFPGMIAVAASDLDGNGRAELLVNVSNDPTQTRVDDVRLIVIRDGAPQTLWNDTQVRAIGPSRRSKEMRIERNGERLAIRINEKGEVTLEPWEREHPPTADFSKVPPVVGPPMPQLLAASILGERNQLLVYQPPTARLLELESANFKIVGEYTSTSIPVLADLDGDSRHEIVLSDVRPDTQPVVEARTPALADRVLWRTQLAPPTRGGLPSKTRPAYLRTARFTGATTPDLYLWAGTPVVRSAALNGRTGELLWDKGECPGLERYWGPTTNLASAYDYDADGREDLVFTNPDYYCVSDGESGDFLHGPNFPPKIFNQPCQGLYTLPAILEEKSGDPTVCLIGGHYFQGVMSLRAEPKWYAIPLPGAARSGEEGFIQSAAGDWLMGFGRQNGHFACVNVTDGTVRWELPVDAACSDVAGCDVDGDGRQEFVFGTSHRVLYAVGDDGAKPRMLWRVGLSGAAGPPIIADVTGDSVPDVIVPTADGYVNVYAGRSATTAAPAPARP